MNTPKRQFAQSDEFRACLEKVARGDPALYWACIHPLLEALHEAVQEVRDLKAERLLRATPMTPAVSAH